MKKFYSILLTICLVATTLMGCATTKTVEPAVAVEETTDNVFNVVTTIFPLYDWTVNVLGDTEGVEVSWLIDNGVDVHSYQPSTDDIIQIAQCDLFIYVGGESDQWVDDALANALNPDMVVVNLMEILGDDAKAEEVVEGMEAH
ncbi:MAG: metal ABC transporter substrate-binding protein, partial [Eubacteriales bacterium]